VVETPLLEQLYSDIERYLMVSSVVSLSFIQELLFNLIFYAFPQDLAQAF
jgi:hypothetical protein